MLFLCIFDSEMIEVDCYVYLYVFDKTFPQHINVSQKMLCMNAND